MIGGRTLSAEISGRQQMTGMSLGETLTADG
jgi:hypothetical protein